MVMAKEPTTPEHEIDIILTNTLSDELAHDDNNHLNNVLRDELRKARECAKPPIVLVIGNPPSSDSFGPHSTGSNFTEIEKLLSDFRPEKSERQTRQNIQKQIGNDFMKFLRWSADKVLSCEMGVLALVLPSTFLAHPTYRPARKWMISNFAEFWVLDFDRDLRTGVRSSSLFNSRQGRVLLLATHKRPIPNGKKGRLYYKAITDLTRSKKKLFLNKKHEIHEFLELFDQYKIEDRSKSLRPVHSNYDRKLYSQFWAIHPERQKPKAGERCIFLRHCSGIKLAPTALFVHPKRPLLQRRSQEIGDMNRSYEDIREQWFAGQRKPPSKSKFTPEVRERIHTAAGLNSCYKTYAFRPFVSMQLLLDNELLRVLSGIGGGGTRLRPEIVAAYSHKNTVGIAIAPSPIDIGDDLHRFATFCWNMPDNDLCSRGNAHIFCNEFPENKPPRNKKWDPEPINNINNKLLKKISEIDSTISSKDIVYYVYAVLCSSTLLDAFADAYFTASAKENIPRVPLVGNASVMRFLIGKGKELAALENPLELRPSQPLFKKYEGLFKAPFNLTYYQADEDLNEIRLYGNGKKIEIVLPDIPDELLRLTISGYSVVQCWLKFHSYAYTRSQFNQDEYRELLSIISSLSKQLKIIEQIDLCMEQIINGKIELML